MLENVAPWVPFVVAGAALVAIVAALWRLILAMVRSVRRRLVAHRTAVITATVAPIIDARLLKVDTALINLQLQQGETRQVVDNVMAIVSDGLSEDVTYLRDRLDDLYDHLIPRSRD